MFKKFNAVEESTTLVEQIFNTSIRANVSLLEEDLSEEEKNKVINNIEELIDYKDETWKLECELTKAKGNLAGIIKMGIVSIGGFSLGMVIGNVIKKRLS